MTIYYKVEFYSSWHCGSGLSAGADVDELAIKDKHGMPFIPGRTLKGLIREAFENYLQFTGCEVDADKTAAEMFGLLDKATKENVTGCLHFSNAELDKTEYEAITGVGAQKYLYGKSVSTAIDAEGTAVDHSLRAQETVVPCTLHASITGVPEAYAKTLETSLGLIKRLGQKRNRGLGRCDFRVEGGER